MKRIIYLRHAKSSWAELGISDKERSLNTRGKRDAPIMSKKLFDILSKDSITLDLILCSTAQRTKETINLFKESNFPETPIRYDDLLYHANENYLLECVLGLDNDIDTVLVCAHNPGISYLAYNIGINTDNIPTCGIFQVSFETNSWTELLTANSKPSFYIYPKKYDI